MKKSKKIIMLIILITGILLTSTGITYSIFSISKTSKNSNLVVGDIYMHYNETNQISLSNVMPSDTYTNDYFEFTVDGKNTTTDKDIWYEIVLNHGDNHETRTERIKDNLLMFRLTEVNDNIETEIFTNKTFSNLENKRIYVNTINKNTTNEIKHTYRLYMWVSDKTKIGNTENTDYDTTTWNNQVYGSIKVNVAGDFNEKTLATPEACFTVGTINDGNEVAILDYDASCGTDVIIPSTIKGYKVTVIGNSNMSYIEKMLNKSSSNKINDLNNYTNDYYNVSKIFGERSVKGSFESKEIQSIIIPDSIKEIQAYAFLNNDLISIELLNSVAKIGYEAFGNNNLENITIGNSIQYISGNAFAKSTSSNPNLSKITINKSCSDIKNIQGSITDTIKYYPWLNYDSPYTATGVTIYGSNNEICDTY